MCRLEQVLLTYISRIRSVIPHGTDEALYCSAGLSSCLLCSNFHVLAHSVATSAQSCIIDQLRSIFDHSDYVESLLETAWKLSYPGTQSLVDMQFHESGLAWFSQFSQAKIR